MSLVSNVHARLAADSTLTALLATYRSAPAVLVADDGTVPGDVRPPFVLVLAHATSDEPDDVKDRDGRDQIVTVRAYAKATGSTVLIGQIAERIRFLLHRKPVGLTDGAWSATCSGPTLAPSDDHFYGRQIDTRVLSLPTPTP